MQEQSRSHSLPHPLTMTRSCESHAGCWDPLQNPSKLQPKTKDRRTSMYQAMQQWTQDEQNQYRHRRQTWSVSTLACMAFLGLAFYSYHSCEATGGFVQLSKHKPLMPRRTHQYALPSLQLQVSERTRVASLQHPTDLSQASGHLKWSWHLCLGKWIPHNLVLTFFPSQLDQKIWNFLTFLFWLVA